MGATLPYNTTNYDIMWKEMKTYIFRVVVEPDEERWFAYCPILEEKGGATWGYTREEALRNIKEVIEVTIAGLIERGEPIPEEPEGEVRVFPEPLVAVTV